MPDVAEHAYWSAPANGTGGKSSAAAAGTAAAAAAAAAADALGEGRNPTLGPQAGAFLAALQQGQQQQGQQQQEEQRQQQQQQQRRQQPADPGAAALFAGRGEARDAGGAGRAPLPNPPFWYSFSHGAVHYMMLSTEHDLEPGSRQYRVRACWRSAGRPPGCGPGCGGPLAALAPASASASSRCWVLGWRPASFQALPVLGRESSG